MNRFQEELKRSGVKLTHQRMEIFREVARTGDHPDAETIYKGVRERVPTVSLDTVYRTLWLLHDFGLISTLGPPRERARFDANMRFHHHFVCVQCGLTRDFYSQELDELKIPKSVKSFGHVETTNVEVRGVCLECANKERSTQIISKEEEV
jgi:Fur family peroxide stress response transcriptional regulator